MENLGRTAKKHSKEFPAWNKWVQDRPVKFWSEMSVLIEGGKCELLADSEGGRIFMLSFYPDMINEIYRYADDSADQPFPSEESLRLSLPENQIKQLSPEYDLLAILADPKKADASILNFNFPEGFGSALVLPAMIPRQITETAILKLRNYLRRYGNKEYVFHKLTTLLHGKESYVNDQLDQILIRPIDLYRSIQESGELTSVFWAHLCSLIKSDIKKKKEHLPMDIAAFQAIHIIEIVNGYFRTVAVKRHEREMAFKALEACLAKPPYFYTMEQIMKFQGPSGNALLNQYSAEELETWLRKQITESSNGGLPSLLIIKDIAGYEQSFILKEKMLLLCARFLTEARGLIRNKISKHWCKLIYNYKSDPAMDSDDDFERFLARLADRYCPDLVTLLADPKLPVLYMEMEDKENGIPPAARVFSKGKLISYTNMFIVRRKDLLLEAKLALPFWYSMPILSALIGFLRRIFSKKKPVVEEIDSEQEIIEEKDRVAVIRAAAEDLELDLVPPGYSIESYLEVLEDRWSRLIDRVAREDLISDVQYLARESLRRTVKLHKLFKPTREILNQTSENIVIRNQALSSITARDSLVFYIELFMIKLLVNLK